MDGNIFILYQALTSLFTSNISFVYMSTSQAYWAFTTLWCIYCFIKVHWLFLGCAHFMDKTVHLLKIVNSLIHNSHVAAVTWNVPNNHPLTSHPQTHRFRVEVGPVWTAGHINLAESQSAANAERLEHTDTWTRTHTFISTHFCVLTYERCLQKQREQRTRVLILKLVSNQPRFILCNLELPPLVLPTSLPPGTRDVMITPVHPVSANPCQISTFVHSWWLFPKFGFNFLWVPPITALSHTKHQPITLTSITFYHWNYHLNSEI